MQRARARANALTTPAGQSMTRAGTEYLFTRISHGVYQAA